jgi:hypothetical protein
VVRRVGQAWVVWCKVVQGGGGGELGKLRL